MASTDATPVPVKNQAFRVTFPIYDNDGDLVTGATGLDSELSGDGGTFADCTNEATEIATSSGIYYLDLTAGEMNYDTVAIIVKTTTTDAKTTPIILYPQANGLDLDVNVTHWNGAAVATPTVAGVPEVDVTHWIGTAAATPTTAGVPEVDVTFFGGNAAVISSGLPDVNVAAMDNGVIGANEASAAFYDTVEARVDTALATYDPPTRAELTTDINSILTRLGTPAGADIAADLATIDANVDAILVDTGTTLPATLSTIDSNVDAILVDTGTTIPAQISGLNNLSAAQVNAEMDTALGDYDGPTRAELTTDINSVLTRLGTPAGADIAADLATIDANVDAILVDTGTTLPATLSTIDSNVDAVLVDTGTTLPAQISGLNNISAAQVNAEVLDVLNTDTFAEPSGVPAATASLVTKIGYLHMALRNEIRVTATKKTFYDDSGAAEWEKDLSDDGTTYTETEANAI